MMLVVLFILLLGNYFLFFFFSSRRRHTRSLCDWSSDVCSSDLAVFSWIEHVQRNARATKLLQQFRDDRIAIGPVGFQFHDAATLKCISHIMTFENIGFVEFAGEAPRSREIDENIVALLQFRLQPFGCERLPVATKL